LIEAGKEQGLAHRAGLGSAGHAAPVEQRRRQARDAFATKLAPATLKGQPEGLGEGVLNGTRRGQLGFARREIGDRVLQCVDDVFLTA